MVDITKLAEALDALEKRVAALQRDRDYWREQHDLVMLDWKADLTNLTGQSAATN